MDNYVARVQGTPSLASGEMNHLNLDANGNLLCNIAQGSFAVSTGAQYNSTPPVLSPGQTGPLQCDVNGKMLIAGTITATSGALANSTPQTFTAGTTNPVQADLHGSQYTSPRDGSGNAMGVLGNPVRVTVDVTNVTQPVSGSVSVSNFPATQPVSGSVSVSSLPALPAGANAIGSVKLTDGASTATIASLTNSKALDVAIVDGSGNQITSFGGGTQYADGATQATPTGTVALAKNGSNVLHALALDGFGNLNVNVAAGGASGGTSSNYASAFPSTGTAIGASDGTNMQPLLVESSTNKNLRVGIYSGANEATVTGANALKVDGTGGSFPVTGTFWQATQPVSGTFWQATQPVSGSVTATISGTPSVSATISGTPNVATVAATSGGCSFKTASADNTVTAIKTSAGQLYGYDLYNANASAVYIQIFSKATASVTLGTTAPDLVIVLPASGGRNVGYPNGIAFGTALCYAVTTTRTGSTAPAANADVNFFYA